MVYVRFRKHLYFGTICVLFVALISACAKPTVEVIPTEREVSSPASPTLLPTPISAFSEHVEIDGKSWFLFGANYPWHSYGNDFGENAWGHNGVSTARTDVETDFKTLSDMGVRVVRWFIFTDGRAAPEFAGDGSVSGLDDKVFADLDAALEIAQQYNIRLIPVLLDFHWLALPKTQDGVVMGGHADVLVDEAKRQSFYKNALLPLLERYGRHPYIIAWEIINEPEWAMDDPTIQTDQPLERIQPTVMQSFVKETAEFINTHADQYVTVGSASRRWWHFWQDAGLDLCQVHYYPWMEKDSPLDFPANEIDATRPCLLGEFPSASNATGAFTLDQYYQIILDNGYAGALPWSLRADDDHSDLTGATSTVDKWALELASTIEIPPPPGWATATPAPTETPVPSPTDLFLPLPSATTSGPSLPTDAAPGGDPSQYGFELRDREWVAQTYDDSQAVTAISRVTSLVHLGNYALQLDVNLLPKDAHLSKGEAYVDVIAFAPLDNSVGPYDFSNSTITCWMYVPVEAYAINNAPWIGLQVFAKDKDYHAEYGSWRRVQVDELGTWLPIVLKPRTFVAPDGYKDDGFDPSAITTIGVKLGVDDGYAEPGIGYNGPIYVDTCSWK